MPNASMSALFGSSSTHGSSGCSPGAYPVASQWVSTSTIMPGLLARRGFDGTTPLRGLRPRRRRAYDPFDEPCPRRRLWQRHVNRFQHAEPDLRRPEEDHERVHVGGGIHVLGSLQLPIDGAPLVELGGLQRAEPLFDVVVDACCGGTLDDQRAQRRPRPVLARLRGEVVRQLEIPPALRHFEFGDELLADGGDEEVRLVAEMTVDRAARELCTAREVAHRDCAVPVLDEEVA